MGILQSRLHVPRDFSPQSRDASSFPFGFFFRFSFCQICIYIYIYLLFFTSSHPFIPFVIYVYIYIYTPCLPPRPITPRFLATASWGETFRWWPHWWRVSFCWPGRLMVASVWQELIWGEFLKFAKSSAIGTLKHFFDVTQWHVFFS